MTFDDVSTLLRRVVHITAARVLHPECSGRVEIRNERYFHHIFSTLFDRHTAPEGQHAWRDMLLHPETPTSVPFRFSEKLNVHDPVSTASYAVGEGKSGMFDFSIRQTPRILLEWKGPTVFSEREIAEVLLKLLTESATDIKIVAGIFLKATTNSTVHRRTIVERFNQFGLAFAQEVLRLRGTPIDLAQANLYACLVTIPNAGTQDIHWGPVTEPLALT